MKNILIVTLLLIGSMFQSLDTFCQKRDAIWCFGDSTGINFNSGTAQPISSVCYSFESYSCVSNDSGNLLFYVGYNFGNNFYIWNNLNNVMQGSNNITQLGGSGTYTQGFLIVTDPGNVDLYYLFTEFYNSPIINLQYHIIDMSQDSGRGAVISANNILCTTCSLTEKMQAVHHANGRDWWLVCKNGPDVSNGIPGFFTSYLISPNGITGPFNQTMGPGYDWYGQMVFSQHGDKVVCADLSRGLNLYDFDRCSGQFSNLIELGYPPYLIFGSDGFYGCSFSPSGRYMYASRLDSVFQYDLFAPNILTSKIFLAKTGNSQIYILGQHKLGADGKIYIANFDWNMSSTLGLDKYLNVINYPDSAGLACGLALYSFSLLDHKSTMGLPNIPNYNLGPVVGSACDSLTGVGELLNKRACNVYPNPANDKLIIELSKQNAQTTIEIYNLNGVLVLQERFNNRNSFLINTKYLNQGLYFYKIISSDNKMNYGKISIIH